MPSQNFSLKNLSAIELSGYSVLSDRSIDTLEKRLRVLKYFNLQMMQLVPLIDLKILSEEWSLACLICTLRGLLFYDVKLTLLNDCLARTRSFLPKPIITLSRQLAKSRSDECLFLQGFRQLFDVEPSRLRQNVRAFEVILENEGAEDAGGPYREAITQFCQDIRMRELGLLIPCPNAKEEVGFNQDKFIVNPSAMSPVKLQQFEFIGKLIGIAIRTKNALDLSLPSIIWKPLVGARLDRNDLESIDKCCCQFLDSIRNIGKEGVTEKTFNDYIFETFTTTSSDGRQVELLKPSGKQVPVTWQNRNEFIQLVEQYRLNEFQLQTDAIFRGVASVIPHQLLFIFTWQELEYLVCGRPGVDLEALQTHAQYCGVSPTDRHVLDFWQVLKAFTAEEQALFLRFVSGHSRLPPDGHFQLQAFTKAVDNSDDHYLPEAQTCFFSLSLPVYSSQEVMREKLLYAINTCKEIDNDFIVSETYLADEEEEYTNNDNTAMIADDEGPGSCTQQ